MKYLLAAALTLAFSVSVLAQDAVPQPSPAAKVDIAADTRIPANSKVFLKPSETSDDFRAYFAAALRKKSVPLLIVTDREQADFEITVTSETKKAGWAKTIFGSGMSEESAAITVTNLKTGVVAFADSSHRKDAVRGKRSTAEKLAKYLGKKMKDDEKMAMKAAK